MSGVSTAPYTRADGATIDSNTLTNNSSVERTVTYTFQPYNWGPNGVDDNGTGDDCLGTTSTIAVVVQPTPAATPSATSQTICSGSSPTLTVDVTATNGQSYLVSAINNPGSVVGVVPAPYTRSDNGTINAGTFTNTTGDAQTVTFTVVPYTRGSNNIDNSGTVDDCLGTPFTVSVIVDPVPLSSTSATSETICSGSNPTITADITAVSGNRFRVTSISNSGGVTGVSTAPYTRTDGAIVEPNALTNATNTSKSVVYTCIPYSFGVNGVDNNGTGDDCQGASFTVTEIVEPTPKATPSAVSQNVCNNSVPTLTVDVTAIEGHNYLVSMISNPGLAGGVSIAPYTRGDLATIETGTLTNTTSGVLTVTYTVVPYTNGSNGVDNNGTGDDCVGTSFPVVLYVQPVATVNATPASETICHNLATNITLTSGTVGVVSYSWTAALISGTAGGFLDGNGNTIAQTLTNTTTAPAIVRYHITPAIGGCSGTPIDVDVTVNPAGQFNQPADQVVCNGAPTTLVIFGTNNTVGTTTYSWINDLPSIGLAPSGTDTPTIPSFTAVNTENSRATATIIVTPTYTNGGVSCAGSPESFTIKVNPTAQVDQPSDQIFCNNATSTVNFSTSNTDGTTTYIWTNDNPDIGLAASGNGNLSFTATNTTTAPILSNIIVTPTYTKDGISCTGSTKTFTITVNPSGQVVQPANQMLCNNTSTAAITFVTTNTVGTTTYSWTNDTPSFGLGESGLGSTIPQFIAINTGFVPVVATIKVTPTYENGGISCSGAEQSFTITVNPTPTVTSPSTLNICSGQAISYTPTSAVAGTTFTWTALNTIGTVTGYTISGSGDISDLLTNTGTGNGQVTYTITPVGPTGCAGPEFKLEVNVVNCNPIIGIAQQLVSISDNDDGSHDAIINFRVQNYGNLELTSISVPADLTTLFGAGNYTVLGLSSTSFDVNTSFTGVGDLLDNSGTTNNLLPGASTDIRLSVRITTKGTFNSSVTVSANSMQGTTSDISQNGSDPDPDGDGDPSNNREDTPILITCVLPTISFSPAEATVCQATPYTFSGVSVSKYSTLSWSVVSGSGTFSNANALNPTFTPSSTGPIILRLTANSLNASCASVSKEFSLIVNLTPTLTATSIVNTTCGNSSGSVQLSGSVLGNVTLNGITQPSGSTFSGLTAGNYVATFVSNETGCSTFANFVIANTNSDLRGIVEVTDAVCSGGRGSATVTVTGGRADYQYALDNAAYGTATNSATATYTDLSVGAHNVRVKDADGCTFLISFEVHVPNPLVLSLSSQTNVSCYGSSEGRAMVVASGGKGPYIYSIDGVNYQSGNVFSDLVASSYTITVKDFNDCTTTLPLTITQPAASLDITTTTAVRTNPTCNGASNGSVVITVSGGTAPYSYVWSNGFNGKDLTGVPAGSYTVNVTDANGCQVTGGSYVLTDPTPVTITVGTIVGTTCGAATGSVVLTSSDASTITLNGTTQASGSTFTGLVAGYYTATSNGSCPATISFRINNTTSTLSATIGSVTSPSCHNGTGSVVVNGSGGTGSLFYSLDGGTTQSSGSFSGVSVGNHTIKVTDANGCAYTLSFDINNPPALTLSLSNQSNVSCFGSATGSAIVVASGGTPGYTYSVTSGPNTPTVVGNVITGMVAGDYNVHVIDSKSCAQDLSVTITQPTNALSVTANKISDALCNGASTGRAMATPSGGSAPYTYLWSNGSTDQTATNLAAGDFTVTVTDKNGCTATSSIIAISQPTMITLQTPVVVNANCQGGLTGSVQLGATGGTGTLTYTISTGEAGNTAGSFSGLSSGGYTYTVTDANGCSVNGSFKITDPNLLTLTVNSEVDVTCYSGSNGHASVMASGGTAPYSFAWTGPGISTPLSGNTSGSNNELTAMVAGNYLVTVTDQLGCKAVQTIEIEQPAELSIQLISKSDEHCMDNNGSIVMGATGGTPNYRFTSTPALSFGTSNSVTNVPSGPYTITVTDVNGCTASMLVTIDEPACVPTVVNDYPSALEDTPLVGNVLTNDSDPNGLPLTVTQFVVGGNTYTIPVGGSNSAVLPGVGSVKISSDGGFTFNPVANYNGSVPTVVYTASNGSGTATGNLSIAVTPVNDVPVAMADAFNATEDVVLTGDLGLNDTPSGDGGNVWSVVAAPAHGSLVINPDGTFTYTPDANYNGPDSFTYKICDVDGSCTTATSVNLNVRPVNNAPVISNVTLAGNEDMPVSFNSSDFSSHFNDIDGDALTTITITSLPANGTLTLNGGAVTIGTEIAVADLPNLKFTPDTDWNGSTSFGWNGSDGTTYANDTKEVVLTIGAVNDLPAAGSATTVPQVNPGGTNNVVVYASNFGGTDVDGAISAIKITTMPANATSITVDGTTYTTIPAGGLQISTDPEGKPLFPISVDPADGVSEVVISYYVVDNLGGVSSSAGTVTVPFSGLSVSGTVYNDVNGLSDNTVGGTGTNVGGVMAVNLVNTANQVVSSKVVGSNGSYSFSDFDGLLAGSSYRLILTNGIQSVGSTLSTATYPSGWVSTGENIGSGAGNDGTIDGILSINTNLGSLSAANFGINSAMTLFAGDDDAICSSVGSYSLITAFATNQSSVTWSTNGTGTFTPDNHSVNAVYHPSVSDIATGQVQLTLTAIGVGSVSTLSDQMTLTIWPAATAYAGPDAAICAGNSFVLTGATATNFSTVTWTGTGGTFDNPNALNPTFTPSTTGEITLRMTVSGRGVCADEFSEMKLTVENAPTLVASAIQNTTCNNSVGAVTLTGNLSGMVTLNGVSKTSPATFTGLTAGYFMATFKPDHTECTAITNFQITNTDNNLMVTVKTTDPLCFGGTGSVVITTIGGTVSGGSVTSTDGYQYRLDGGTAQAGNTFTGLSVGNHTVRVTDDNGCYYSIEFDIDQPKRLGLSLSSKTNITCQGAEIGEAMVWAYGGTPGYTYQLNTLPVGSSATMDDNIISNMTAGNYTVQVMDDNGCVATLPIVITKAICKPIAVNDLVVSPGDVPAQGNVLTNDTDPNGLPLTVTKFNVGGISYNPGDIATIEGVGTMVVKGNGDFTFIPLPNYHGTVPVTTYTVSNGSEIADASIFMTITPVNHTPVANPDTYNGLEDAIIKGNLGTNDALSGDGGNIWSPEVAPLHGTVTVNIDGTFTYVPESNYNGPDQFSYKLCDVDGSCSIGVVDLIVTPVNDAPEAIDDQSTTEEDHPVSGNVLLNDTDLDGDPLKVTQFTVAGDSRIYAIGDIAQIPNVGELLLEGDGHYTFHPALNYNGDVPSVTYTISDGSGGLDTALLDIRITPVNDPPIPENDSFNGVENTPIEGDLIGNDIDPDGDVIKVTTTPLVAPLHGSLILMPDGRFTYKPIIDFMGTDSFVYEVCDNGNPTLCASATVNINIGKDTNCEVFVPSSFSPNGDGLYDYFKVRCLYNYENAVIQIYNRWGNLVYSKDHYGNTDFWGSDDEAWWNGRSDHKWNITNDELPVGTYYYVLKLDKSKVLTGYLYLNK